MFKQSSLNPNSPTCGILIIGSLEGGGAERVLTGIANYWALRGWNIFLITTTVDDSKDFYSLEPRISRIHLSEDISNCTRLGKVFARLKEIYRLRRTINRIRPDFVLSFLDVTNIITIASSIGVTKKIIVSERIHPKYHAAPSKIWGILRRILYPFASVVVVQTKEISEWTKSHYKCQTVVIPNSLRNLPNIHAHRNQIVLAVGRLHIQKGFDLLIRAFAAISKKHPEWNLQIIGSGREYKYLTGLIKDLGIEHRATILSPVKDIEYFMASAGLFVLPSRYEGFPNVVLEAMGMGASVIATNCPSGPSEIITSGVNGILVPVEDVDNLADAMNILISDKQLRERLGTNAKVVRETYNQYYIMKLWEETCIGNK